MAFPHRVAMVDRSAASNKDVAATKQNHSLSPSMTTISSTTAVLNNQGVDCLRASDWTQALNFFRAALSSTASDCSAAENLSMDEDGLEPTLPSTPVTLANQVVSLHPSVSSDFLHAVGFYLNPVAHYFGSDTVHNCAVQSAVVWYNLGVLLHVKSFDGVSSEASNDNAGARMRLDKALTLYMRTKSVLEALAVFDHSFRNDSPGLLQVLGMATLNNLAYGLHQKEHWNASQECLLDLSQWIFELEKQYRCNETISSIDMASLEVFEWVRSSCLLNAMILHPPNVAGAA